MEILTRPPLALAAVVLLLVTRWPTLRRAATFGGVVGGFVAVLLAAVADAVMRCGAPHGTAGQLFTWASLGPNSRLHITWLLTIHTPIVALLFAAGAWFDRSFAWRAGLMFLAVAFPYLVYAPRFEDWEILRFLLPGMPFIAAVCACGASSDSPAPRPAAAAARRRSWRSLRSPGRSTSSRIGTSSTCGSRNGSIRSPLRGLPRTTERAVAIAALHTGGLSITPAVQR
jgi:hypothetical protein